MKKLILSLSFIIFLFSVNPVFAWTSSLENDGNMSITWTDEDILALPALDGCSGSSNPYYLTYDLAMKNGNMLSDLSDSAYDSNAISTVLVSNHSGTKAMGIDFLILPYTTIRLGVIYENQNQDCSSTIAVSSNFLLSSMPWDSENTSAPTPSN